MPILNCILIIDDNEIDHIAVKYALEEYDPSITMLSAYDGSEALTVLASCESPPDLIFLDINMPGMDGHTFLSEYAKATSSAAVIVMLTSSDQYEDRNKCEAYDFVKDYVTKPLDVEYLKAIESLL